MAEIVSPAHDPEEVPTGSGATLMWWVLTYEDAEILCRVFADRKYSPSHVNKHLTAFRQVLKTAWRLKYFSAEEYARSCGHRVGHESSACIQPRKNCG